MKTAFAKSSNPVLARWSVYQEIRREMDLVRRDKLSAHPDLDHCFMMHDENPGRIGKIFKAESARSINRLIVARNNQHLMPSFPLPVTLANTQTRALMEKLYPHSAEREQERLETKEWLEAATGLDIFVMDMSKEVCPESLNLFYVGDFLDCVERAINLDWQIKTSAMLGDGQNTLEIIRRLRHIPDYSHHFPNHRPPPGGPKKRDDRPAVLPMGDVQPLRL